MKCKGELKKVGETCHFRSCFQVAFLAPLNLRFHVFFYLTETLEKLSSFLTVWFALLFQYLPITCRSTFLKAHKAKNLPMM